MINFQLICHLLVASAQSHFSFVTRIIGADSQRFALASAFVNKASSHVISEESVVRDLNTNI